VIIVSAIVAAGSLAFTLGTVFQCTPVHRAWDHRVPDHCLNNEAFWYSHAAFNIFFDIVVRYFPSGWIPSATAPVLQLGATLLQQKATVQWLG